MTRLRAFAALTAVVMLASACGQQGSAPPTLAGNALADSAEQVMLGVRTLLTDKGVQRGELFADSAYVFDNSTRFELRKVHATFNTTAGVKDGTLQADRGRYSTSQQVLEGFGHVVVANNAGRRLSSSQLRYNQSLNEVSSDSAFTLNEPSGRVVTGIGFRSDPQLNNVRILRGAGGTGSFTLPGT